MTNSAYQYCKPILVHIKCKYPKNYYYADEPFTGYRYQYRCKICGQFMKLNTYRMCNFAGQLYYRFKIDMSI